MPPWVFMSITKPILSFWAAERNGFNGGESYTSTITLLALCAAHLCRFLHAASNWGPAQKNGLQNLWLEQCPFQNICSTYNWTSRKPIYIENCTWVPEILFPLGAKCLLQSISTLRRDSIAKCCISYKHQHQPRRVFLQCKFTEWINGLRDNMTDKPFVSSTRFNFTASSSCMQSAKFWDTMFFGSTECHLLAVHFQDCCPDQWIEYCVLNNI